MFEQLLDAAPDATVGVDRTGTIVFANAQTLRLFGYERDELLGRPSEVVVPDDIVTAHRGLREKYFAAATHRAMGAGNPLYARRKDGSAFPTEISLSGLTTGDGLIVSAAVRDISYRLRAEAARRGNSYSLGQLIKLPDKLGRGGEADELRRHGL